MRRLPLLTFIATAYLHAILQSCSLVYARQKGRQLRRLVRSVGCLLILLAGAGLAGQANATLIASMSIATDQGYTTTIYPGDVTAFRIALTNSDSDYTVSSVTFSDVMPAGMTVAGVGVKSYTCTDPNGGTVFPTGTVNAPLAGNTIALVDNGGDGGGTIPKAQTPAQGGLLGKCEIVVEVTVNAAGAPVNTIAGGGVTGTDNGAGVSNADPAMQSITVLSLNAPTISKSFSPGTIVKSDQRSKLSIVIGNTANATRNLPLNDATAPSGNAFAIRDILPTGLAIATPLGNVTSTCAGTGGVAPTFAPVAGDTQLIAYGGTVPAGGTCTLTVDVIGTPQGDNNQSNGYLNTIRKSLDFGNTRNLVPASDATATATVKSALFVSTAFTPGTVAAGTPATMTITLANASPLNAITVGVDDPIIDGLAAISPGYGLTVSGISLANCGTGSGTVTGDTRGVTITNAVVPAGGSCVATVTYTGSVPAGAGSNVIQTYTNSIPVTNVHPADPNVIGNAASSQVNVASQLTVDKVSSSINASSPIAPGNPVQYTVTLKNFSLAALLNVHVQDTLPAGFTGLTGGAYAPSFSGACTGPLTDTISGSPAAPTFTIASISGGSGPNPASCVIVFYAMVPANAALGSSSAYSNTIPAGAAGNGGNTVTNGNPSQTVTATVASVIAVNKIYNPASTFEGTISRYTVTFTNLSASPLTAASFTETLPQLSATQQLVIADTAAASSTCTGATVTAVSGTRTLSISGATIPARATNGTGAYGTCTVSVNIVGPAGTYNDVLVAGELTGTETLSDNTTRTAQSPLAGTGSTTMVYTSALTAAKSFSPATISSGGTSRVTIRLTNTAAGTLNNVSVVDGTYTQADGTVTPAMPAGMVLATPLYTHTTCGGSPVITGVAGAALVRLTGAVLPPSGACDFQFDVTATGPGNWTNTLGVDSVTAAGGVKNTGVITALLTNNTAGGVVITVNTNPNNLSAPGTATLLTVQIQNTGTVDLSNLALTDYFTTTGAAAGPLSGMIIAATPNATTDCLSGIATATADGTSVALTGAALAHGATCNLMVNVTLRTTGAITNTIPVGAITTAQGISNTLATSTTLSAGANVGVTKSFSPSIIQPGARSRLHLSFFNTYGFVVSALTATDNLPAGMTIATSPNPVTTCAGATVTGTAGAAVVGLSGGTLPAAVGGVATTCYAEIDVTAPAGSYTNTIPANTGVTGSMNGGPVHNPEPATAPLEVRTPVAITKAFSLTSVLPGVPTSVTITINNAANPVALTRAVLADNLPANLSVALIPNASTTCAGGVVNAAASATSVILTGATIPASGSCVVKFDAVSNVAGTYVNTIPAGNLATATGVTNETPASATVVVQDPPTVNKQFNPASIPVNGTSTLTIYFTNTGTDATLSSAMVDTLPISPGNIVVAAIPALTSTCTGTAATAAAGGASVTLPAGAKIPTGGCAVSVNVTGTLNGTYNNYIAAGALKTDHGNNVQPATANLVISPLGFISGRVFKDNNNPTPDGIYQPGTDTPLTGVTINLTGTDYGANGVPGGGDDTVVNLTTNTDALGNYAFIGLNPGKFTVTEPNQPAGTMNGITTAAAITGAGGGTAGVATTVAVTPSVITDITLGKDGSGVVSYSAGNNFAEIAVSSISGTVFLDQGNDGVKNSADTAIAGVTLELLNSVSSVIATTVTDSSGNYTFSNLVNGTYSVREPAQPPGTANGWTIAGTINGVTVGTATAATVVPSLIGSIVLPPNASSINNNFAEVPTGRQVSGRVYYDNNNDGLFNGSDTGIANYSVTLTGTDFNGFPVTQTALTGSDGRYVFSGLAAGTYAVTEPVQPPNSTNGITTAGSIPGTIATALAVTPSVISSIDLTGFNTISSENNFGEIYSATKTASISGHVYVDANNDGVMQSGETGILNVLLTLTGTDSTGASVNLTTVTVAGGSYTFDNLQPSNASGYTVTETQPAAYTDGKTTIATGNSGSAKSSKPVTKGNPDTISGIALLAGVKLIDYNFGEISAGNTLSGFVYVDTNKNGLKDSDETGIAGVTVALGGKDITGAVVALTTSTGADGSYSFLNLQPSDATGYTITETQPAAYTDGKNSIASGNPGAATSTKPVAAGQPDAIVKVVLPAGGKYTDYNFGEVGAINTISGFVYVDANNNGVKDADEKPIGGVTVKLSGTDINGAIVDKSVVTGDDGSFAFTQLQPSNGTGYTITELQPAMYKDGKTTITGGSPGTATGTKPIGVGNMDIITGVKLVSGTSLSGYLFGEIGVPTLIPPIVNGYVWMDRAHNRVRPLDGQPGEPNWTVQLRQNSTLICTVTTDDSGFYQFDNLHCPGYESSGLPVGSGFSITFSKDGNMLPNVPISGGDRGQVPATGGQIMNITLTHGDAVVEQDLPLDPSGVVYDSTTRQPIAGAVVTINGPAGFVASTHLVGGAMAAVQTTGTDGMYTFLLQNGFPSGVYTLTVTAPANYLPAPSTALPACANTLTVGMVPTPAQIQASDYAPGLGVPQQLNPNTCVGLIAGGANSTQYYFSFMITNGGSAPILNNHIPLDPATAGTIIVTKTTQMVNVSRGDLVPYTITATNTLTTPIANVAVQDQLPPGFKFRTGSARYNGVTVTPTLSGRLMTYPAQNFAPKEKKTYNLILVIGSGVGDGEYTNQAWAATNNRQISNLATATVRIVPDPTFDCPDIIGKVFDDRNANGYQDEGEPGIPNVRMATVRGLLVTTDSDGRFHVPCPEIPNADRGSNFVMKLDERTLPSGYRVTTENPRDVRITRGKVAKLNFGATIHRVVRLELEDAAFDKGSDKLLPAWQQQVDALPEKLKLKPSVVRIAYKAGNEPADLINQRVDHLRDAIRERWKALKGEYTLVIETEGE